MTATRGPYTAGIGRKWSSSTSSQKTIPILALRGTRSRAKCRSLESAKKRGDERLFSSRRRASSLAFPRSKTSIVPPQRGAAWGGSCNKSSKVLTLTSELSETKRPRLYTNKLGWNGTHRDTPAPTGNTSFWSETESATQRQLPTSLVRTRHSSRSCTTRQPRRSRLTRATRQLA